MSALWESPDIGLTSSELDKRGGLLDGDNSPLPHTDFLIDASVNMGMADAYNTREAGEKIADIANHLALRGSGLAGEAKSVADAMHSAEYGNQDDYHDLMNDAIDRLHPLVGDVLEEHTRHHPDDWWADETDTWRPPEDTSAGPRPQVRIDQP